MSKRSRTARAACLIVLLAGLSAGCATVPPEQDPVLIKLTQLENRLMKVERLLDNQSLLDLHAQVQQLKAETMELRGVVEKLQFDADGAAKRQRDQYLDLDGRIAGLEQGVAAIPGAPVTSDMSENPDGSPDMAAPQVDDQTAYQAAFALLKAGRYDEASVSFAQFLNTYSESGLRDNAQYWLAESHYVVRKYTEALPLFERVINEHPQSRKAPDALLKIGFCRYELGQYDAARAALRQVVDNHGDTTAGRLARQRLERMRAEGR